MKALCLIPARGGSKSIPKKNIRMFGRHPLIAYSITAALCSKSIDRVIVSTDNEEIASIARDYGAETPFIRPAELAQDDTTDFPVFEHAFEWLVKHEGWHADIIVHLRPTQPILPKGCVEDGIKLLIENSDADSVRSIVPSAHTPYKMWKIQGKFIKPILQSEYHEAYNMPRQKLPTTYTHSGQVDVIWSKTISKKKSMTGSAILPLLIDSRFALDIDTPDDWEYGEWLLNRIKNQIYLPEIDSRVDKLLAEVEMVILDFDGVVTDNKVIVYQDGSESVLCDRSDGMGISMLKKNEIKVFVLSTETNPVVSARCKKLNIPHYQGVLQKHKQMKKLISDHASSVKRVAFAGNDINDLECFKEAGICIAVADAHEDLLKIADIVLQKPGGSGAIRELSEMILDAKGISWEKQ